jgi:Uma2 family endonuclease
VKEYWIVDPLAQLVEVYGMRDHAYRLLAIQEAEGVVASSVLTGFEVDVKVLFDL